MHLPALPFVVLLASILPADGFTLNPYNEYDPFYESRVRTTLGSFHPHLSAGEYAANRPMVSDTMHWNDKGLLLVGGDSYVNHLTAFNVTFHGIQAPDRYHLVDGHVGAVMYRLQGRQTAEVAGVDTGNKVDILGGELMDFDSDGLLNVLYSIEEIGLLVDQLTGKVNVSRFIPVSLADNPQTSADFRTGVKKTVAMLHENFNTGVNERNGALANADVRVQADTIQQTGRTAFAGLFDKWKGAFPDMLYHDDYVLADGQMGCVAYVWQGTQTGKYKAPNGTTLAASGKPVRVRGMSFFEFDGNGLISSVVNVHDEAVIAQQLEGQSITPLYP